MNWLWAGMSKPEVGSSSINILVSMHNARARNALFCCPPESSPMGRLSRPSSPTILMLSATASLSFLVANRSGPMQHILPIITTSKTETGNIGSNITA